MKNGADRQDARSKVTGRATYAAEHDLADLVHAAIVPSTIARGRVTSLDVRAASGLPGVLHVVTPDNRPAIAAPEHQLPGGMGEGRVPLQDLEVRHAGQPLAVVIATTLEIARHAATLVRVTYASERPIVSIQEDQQTFEPDDFFGIFPMRYRRGDVASALSEADVRLEETYETSITHHNPMEPHATIAAWDGDHLTLYDTTQGVFGTRGAIAAALQLPHARVRVISPFLGGGFGCKGFVWPRVVLAAVAARIVGRPVKLVLERDEMFTSNGYRAGTVQRLCLGAKLDGTLTAIRLDARTHTSTIGDFFEPVGCVVPKLYAAPNVQTHHSVTRLDLGTPTACRAPGEAPGAFALECALDELAHRLHIDPVELRIRNHAANDPEKGKPWSSKHLIECYRRGAERIGWARRDARQVRQRDGYLHTGIGMATASYPANRDAAAATVRVLADGRAEVLCAAQDLGTGSYTIMSQIAADVLGLPIERVTSRLGDTALPRGPLAGGSRTAASIGPAVRAAAEQALRELRARGPGVAVEGHATVDPAGTDAARPDEPIQLKDGKPVEPFSWQSFGVHFAEVQVDAELRTVRVTRVVTVLDVGRVLNAKTARSQIEGGVIWGVGMALMERSVADPRTGRFVTRDLAEYLVPTHPDTPEIEVEFLDIADPHFNVLGARGVGEIGIVGVAAAIANAVFDATGRRVRKLPISLQEGA